MHVVDATLDVPHHPTQSLLHQLVPSHRHPELLSVHHILDAMVVAADQYAERGPAHGQSTMLQNHLGPAAPVLSLLQLTLVIQQHIVVIYLAVLNTPQPQFVLNLLDAHSFRFLVHNKAQYFFRLLISRPHNHYISISISDPSFITYL